jgi:NAD(P)-dependent dehydrogenase (short-subunit alcohol dehydrogenase family)
MRESGDGGSIINTSSVAGLKGSAILAGYCATKGGVRLLSKAVAMECAAEKIRVNSIHPGIIETPIWESIVRPGPEGTNAPPDLDALSTMAVPMGVKGLPADIANGVLWLASDESRYVTAAELVIDGGQSQR